MQANAVEIIMVFSTRPASPQSTPLPSRTAQHWTTNRITNAATTSTNAVCAAICTPTTPVHSGFAVSRSVARRAMGPFQFATTKHLLQVNLHPLPKALTPKRQKALLVLHPRQTVAPSRLQLLSKPPRRVHQSRQRYPDLYSPLKTIRRPSHMRLTKRALL